MSERKHTPGPWTVRIEGTQTGRGPEVCTDSPFYDDGEEFVVADCGTSATRPGYRHRWKRTDEADMVDANARLIAAAPDLLAALEGAEQFILDDSRSDRRRAEVLAVLRAAVAKAVRP